MHDSHYRKHGPWTRVSFGRGPCSRDLGLHEPWTRFVFTAVLFVVLYPSVLPTEKIANMMSLQTENKLSYTTEFVITYEKEKIEKVTVVGYHVGLYAIAKMRRTKTTTFLLDTQRDYASQWAQYRKYMFTYWRACRWRQYKIGYSDI